MRMIDGHSLDLDDVSYEGRGEVKIGTHLVINMINFQNHPPEKQLLSWHLHQSESHWSSILNRSPWVTDKVRQWSDSGKFDNHQSSLSSSLLLWCRQSGRGGRYPSCWWSHDTPLYENPNKMITYCWRSWTTLFVSSYSAARPSWLPCQRPPRQPGLHGWKF